MSATKALATIPRRMRAFCFSHTRGGKVNKLENLTKSLSSNTQLVKQKYGELKVVESEVQVTLEKLKSETFDGENKEIESLALISREEKNKFKGALVKIKDHGIAELTPISETAQRIKAHMLVTLNKAQVQKAILVAKSRLASNAHLQLETIKVIEKETKSVNVELKDLLMELDNLNEEAVNRFSSFQTGVQSSLAEDSNIISHIFNKLEKGESPKTEVV